MATELPLTYRHNPRPVGYPVSYRLVGDELIVDNGRKISQVRLGAVEQVRLTYDARSFAQRAFKTQVRLKDGRTFALSSMSWKSLVEAEALDAEYRGFVCALLQAVARASPGARFIAGKPRLVWVATAAIAALLLLTIAAFVWRGFQVGALGAALLGLCLGAAGIWQLEPMVRLNRPRGFEPHMPPSDLLP